MVEDELKRSVGVGSCGGVRGKIKNGQRRRGKKKKEKNEIRRFGMVTARPGMFFFSWARRWSVRVARPCRL